MTLFSWLLIGHLVGDFLLQTKWMAEGKTKHILPLLVHAAVYTGLISAIALFYQPLRFKAVIFIFFTHVLLDQRTFVHLWAKHITGTTDKPWLIIMIDQSWHIIVLAIVTLLG